MAKERDYVLGTHDAEVDRLGLQHRVWRPRVSDAWRRAGFTVGQALLDVGCGPGFAALDLAGIVGPTGRIVAVDRSRRFLDVAAAAARARGHAHLETHELDLDEQPLPCAQLDGAWSRWVYAFVRTPRAVLAKVVSALRLGGVVVMHEYVDYRAWRISPRCPAMEEFVAEVVESWRGGGGEPDIALELPRWLEELGCELLETRPISELARPGGFLWEWPRAFLDVGMARLVELGRMDAARAAAMRAEIARAEAAPGAFMITPTVLEIVARKR
jgi:SAM-dependent methyltransferase